VPVDLDAAELARRPFDRHGLRLRPLDLERDVPVLHRWFTQERAHFWGMQALSEREVLAAYGALLEEGHALACIGEREGRPAFLLECYDPARGALGRCYRVRRGDIGMHVFVGPPDELAARERGFTRRVFHVLMAFIFERLRARRIVVEPDVRNERIHVLNREMGFVYQGYAQLETKLAALAFCTRERYVGACRRFPPPRPSRPLPAEQSE
jgi:RimJ/RimL family protein N-acetyltransferase